MILKRRKNFIAAGSMAVVVIASLALSGCSNPYEAEKVDPSTVTATEGPNTYTPEPFVTDSPTDDITAAPDAIEDSPRTRSTYFGIDAASVTIPQEYTDKFGESAKTIVSNGLYNMEFAGSLTEYQRRPLTNEDKPLLIVTLHNIFSTNGETKFKAALDGTDGTAYRRAFQIMPYLITPEVQIADTTYVFDETKVWNVVYWNVKLDPISEDTGTADAANLTFNRSVYIPTKSGESLRFDAIISLQLIPDASGNWVINDWAYNQNAAEVEKQ